MKEFDYKSNSIVVSSQKFDPAVDLPLKDASGNIIMKLFRASSSVMVEDKG